MADHTAQSTTKLDISTTLAFERTRVAYERTILAWVRTATSLITFGFSIYKFFQLEREGGGQNHHLIGPREFALLLVGIGLISLLKIFFTLVGSSLDLRWYTSARRAAIPPSGRRKLPTRKRQSLHSRGVTMTRYGRLHSAAAWDHPLISTGHPYRCSSP